MSFIWVPVDRGRFRRKYCPHTVLASLPKSEWQLFSLRKVWRPSDFGCGGSRGRLSLAQRGLPATRLTGDIE